MIRLKNIYKIIMKEYGKPEIPVNFNQLDLLINIII